ncbi:hypothetical protein [Pontibacter sp. G13]|uniref:hypothetical protein n=1 Tax=Pontibacter sp. G13 TaxID=3074898 RepID=UPI00288A6D18|nr:hypothetical protein [Pontibacter sp. G13]WNJ20809.1 hypothetical protein RJD25_10025 [Pontibacter sp. G13]
MAKESPGRTLPVYAGASVGGIHENPSHGRTGRMMAKGIFSRLTDYTFRLLTPHPPAAQVHGC